MKNLSKKEAIKFGWEQAKKNWQFYVSLLLVYFLVQAIPQVFVRSSNNDLVIITALFIFGLVISYFKILMDMGFIKIALLIVDGKKPKFSDLISQTDLF